MIQVRLPWPARPLWPNAKAHWRARARALSKSKGDAYTLAHFGTGSLMRQAGPKRLMVTMEFMAPTKRRYDLDNALAACKGALDGIAQAMDVDDSCFRFTLARGEPVKGGGVLVTIRES